MESNRKQLWNLNTRTEKRFTVTFRGSVSTKDWMIDASIRKTTPDMIKSFAGEDVEFHRGFVCKCNQKFGSISIMNPTLTLCTILNLFPQLTFLVTHMKETPRLTRSSLFWRISTQSKHTKIMICTLLVTVWVCKYCIMWCYIYSFSQTDLSLSTTVSIRWSSCTVPRIHPRRNFRHYGIDSKEGDCYYLRIPSCWKQSLYGVVQSSREGRKVASYSCL